MEYCSVGVQDSEIAHGVHEFLIKRFSELCTAIFESFRSLCKFSVARGYSKQGFARAKTPRTPSDGQGLSYRANGRTEPHRGERGVIIVTAEGKAAAVVGNGHEPTGI